jgi:acetyl-CoA carboxylase biotin carboxyl carrier protein
VDLSKIEELIALMRKSGLTQLSLELPDYKVSITRGREPSGCAPGVAEGGPAAEAAIAPVVVVTPAEADPPGAMPLTVIAPVVGVFRNGGGSSGKQMEVGKQVQRGQLLGVIEAMKVPNEVRSPVEGVVTAVGVADGAAVEYGQMLFQLLPEEGGEVDEGESTLGMA